jgi:uncharacterized YigZ family protein
MLRSYRTIQALTVVETAVKKSKFIAYAQPVSSEEQASSFLQAVKKKHMDASHHCYAFIMDDQLRKFSDDGEPSGTAGKPILEAIQYKGLQQVAVVVVRYFGGTMLGAGGLVRAYSEAATLVLTTATIIERRLHQQWFVTIDYHWLGRIEHEMRAYHWRITDTEFGEKVRLSILVDVDSKIDVLELVNDSTQGQADIEIGEQVFIPS